MAKKLVLVRALKAGVTTVRGERVRENIVTNPDSKADAAALKADPRLASAHEFQVTPDVAEQLAAKGMVEIVDLSPKGARATRRPPTVAETAAGKLGGTADADAEGGDSISGADSRDSSAFARPPLSAGTNTGAADEADEGDEEEATADAAPTGDEDEEEAGDEGAADEGIGGQTVPELKKSIAAMTDKAALSAMRTEEAAGKKRSGVIAAIDARLVALD